MGLNVKVKVGNRIQKIEMPREWEATGRINAIHEYL